MTTTKNVFSTLAALAVSTTVFAQTEPTAPVPTGSASLLGQRYVDYGVGFLDVNHSRIDAYAAGLTVNLPIAANIDVAVDYAYGWAESNSDVDTHDLSVDGIYYFDSGRVKPFGGLTLGYNWNDWKDDWFWGAFGGLEYQLTSQVVLQARADYTADFDDADEGSFSGLLSARYFFTPTVAAMAGVEWLEGGSTGYIAGVTLKF